MRALFRKAYRDVTKRRLRSLLTLAGITIGVAGVVAIAATGQNLARAQADAYAHASQADITLWVWDAPVSTERAVVTVEHVAAAELRSDFSTRCRVVTDGGTPNDAAARDVLIYGVQDFANARVDQVFLTAGRLPREGEFVAEQSAFAAAGLRLGDTLRCRGRAGNPERTLTLVGVVQRPNYPSASILDYLTAYASASDVKQLLGTAGANGLLVKVDDSAQAHTTANKITQLLDRRGIYHGAPTIRDPQNFVGKRELDALLLLLSVFSGVGLLTSGFLVANTLAAIAAEQVGEIGTLKAVGGTRLQVFTIYLLGALLYGVVGTALGLALGVFASWQLLAYIGSLLNLSTGFEIAALGLALGAVVGIGVTLVAGAVPSFAATAISVKRALEAYGITLTYGQGRVERLVLRLVALPPLAAMSLRNLARRKSRTLVTVFVIAVAVATSLAAQSVSASVDTAIDNLFRTYRADAWLWFGEYVSTAFEAKLRAVPHVEAAETWSLQNVWVATVATNEGTNKRMVATNDMTNGRMSTAAARARLWGLPADTTLYVPHVVEGRWYRAEEHDAAVISSDLVQALGLRVDDVIQVDTGSDPRYFRVVGIAVDNSVFLGSTVAGKVFMREDLVASMQRREGYATFFAVAFDAHDATSVEARLDQIAARFNRYQLGSDSAAREVRGAKEQTRILTLALAVMSLLVGAIGALGVLNTLTLNVLERRREIGVLRAVGASDVNLAQTFLTEGLAFGLGGWALGLALGYPLGLALTRIMETVLFHIDYIFSAQMLATSLAFALVLTSVASIAPALAAARVRAGEVLRYE